MKKGRAIFSLVLVLILSVGLFVGCGQKDEQSNTDTSTSSETSNTASEDKEKDTTKDKTVELRIVTMFGGTDPATQVLEHSLKDFQADNPNIKIKNESMTAVGDEFRTKVKTDFASGNAPDVTFFFTGADVKGIIEAGAVVPYEEVWKDYPETGKDISQGIKDSMREFDGNIYALPLTGFYEGLFVNKALFDKYNLDLPTDWDKLLKAVEVFNENGIVPFAGPLQQSHYLIEHFVLSQAGAQGHKDVLANGVPSDWVEGLNNIKALYEMGAFSPDALTVDIETAQNLFKAEQAAMILEGSWFIGGCEEALQSNMTAIPMPVAPNGKMDSTSIIAGYTSGYYISRKAYDDADKQEAVVKLVSYLTSAEQIKAVATANGGTPSASVTVEGLSPVALDGHKMAADAATLNLPIDSRLTPEAFNYIVKEGTPFIAAGERTAEEVLEKVKEINNQ